MTDKNALSLSVPYVPELDNIALEDMSQVLADRGTRFNVECLNWKKEFPYHPLASYSIAHSGKFIYIDFFVRCNYLRAVTSENNGPVHQDSCVEFFVEPTGELPYYNFEFNCIGTIHAARRMNRHEGTPLTDEQLASVARFASCGTKPFNEVEGLFSWNLVVAIPLELLGLRYEGKPIEMRGNFYKCADRTAAPHFLSWAPIDTPQPDFHRPEFFRPIVLE